MPKLFSSDVDTYLKFYPTISYQQGKMQGKMHEDVSNDQLNYTIVASAIKSAFGIQF